MKTYNAELYEGSLCVARSRHWLVTIWLCRAIWRVVGWLEREKYEVRIVPDYPE
jgi:hypothetical protein